MKEPRFSRYYSYAVLAVVLALLPVVANTFLTRNFYLHLIIIVGIMAIMALSLNLIIGYAGQISLAHAGFYGIGAYTSALLTIRLGWSFWFSMLAACLFAAVAGIIIGYPALRLKGIYFAIVTFAFGELMHMVFLNWKVMTKGDDGLQDIPMPWLFGLSFSSKFNYAYLVLFFVLVTVFVLDKLVTSRIGRTFTAIREDEYLGEAMGINAMKYKLFAFAVAALFAGLGGSLYAHYLQFISPVTFTGAESMFFIAAVIIGGMGTLAGPLIGAILLTMLPEVLRSAQEYTYVIYGLILILAIIFMPTGIVGFLKSLNARRGTGPQTKERKVAVESRGDTAS